MTYAYLAYIVRCIRPLTVEDFGNRWATVGQQRYGDRQPRITRPGSPVQHSTPGSASTRNR